MADLKNVTLALVTAGLLSSGAGQAALFDRGGGLIYDSDLNITWLRDANYAQTSGYDADGKMNWSEANAWIANLVYHDNVRNVDYTDWRLYSALNKDRSGPCEGYNCTGNEMGHLFYTEGGLSEQDSILNSTILDDYFINMQSYAYWSGTELASNPGPAGYAWHFHTDAGGYQDAYSHQYNGYYAWAVRPGDVAAPIPEPEIYAMMSVGLGLMGWIGRRRKQKLAA